MAYVFYVQKVIPTFRYCIGFVYEHQAYKYIYARAMKYEGGCDDDDNVLRNKMFTRKM